MNTLKLSSILTIGINCHSQWKARFNKHGKGIPAFDKYLDNDKNGKFDEMTLWCEKRSMIHKGEKIIGFARLTQDTFLLVKIYEILDEDSKIYHSANRYKYRVMSEFEELFGRVVVGIRSDYSKSYPVISLDKLENDSSFCVLEIKPSPLKDEGFKGYDNVCLSFAQLKRIIEKQLSDWTSVLSNQKAVYLITDLYNGQLYVGSATSSSMMLLDRWSSYIKNGHGGNKEFKKIVNDKTKGIKYIETYFQYSILEVFNSSTDDSFILKRERYWKKVFDSIKHGLNDK